MTDRKVPVWKMREYLESLGVETEVDLGSERLYVTSVNVPTPEKLAKLMEISRSAGVHG